MARERKLKPSFFDDEDIADLSPWARLLFLGLWGLADRRGRLEERQQWVRVKVFPYDDLEALRVSMASLLEELAKDRRNSPGGFIRRYEVGGKRYIQIVNFEKHQKFHPDEKETEIPPPPPVTQKPRNPTAGREIQRRQKRQELSAALVLEPDLDPVPVTDLGAGAPPAAPAKADPVEFPSKRAANVFHKHYPDGAPPGAMFKHLRPLVLKHGWEAVEPELDAYLTETEIQFQSWPKFAAGYGTWVKGNGKALVLAGSQARAPTTAGEKSVQAAARYLERRSSGGDG